ncbi:unnamed protein product [Amoebophrya sp. A120]|nr:unnamed protein product [Amoebophrya sp. A120]|eukprot:GSA120T00019136001.1
MAPVFIRKLQDAPKSNFGQQHYGTSTPQSLLFCRGCAVKAADRSAQLDGEESASPRPVPSGLAQTSLHASQHGNSASYPYLPLGQHHHYSSGRQIPPGRWVSTNCAQNETQLARMEHIIDTGFTGQLGPGYLMSNLLNYTCGPEEERMLMTGKHVVCDVSCVRCQTVLGWKYLQAYQFDQKYKEGKFVVEACRVTQLHFSSSYGVEEQLYSDDTPGYHPPWEI